MQQINWKKILTFLLITFTVSFGWIFCAYALKLDVDQKIYLQVLISYMFIPAISAIITQYIYKERIINPLQINFKLSIWWVIAWLLPLVIALLTFWVSLYIPENKFSPDMAAMFDAYKGSLTKEQITQMHKAISQTPQLLMFLMLSLGGLVAGLSANAVAAFGEELGWRGFLMRQLAPLGFWRSSFIIGIIWGIWHAPLILHGYNYPQHPQIGVLMMIAFCLLYTPIICYIRLQSRSVLAAAIMHGTINGTYQISIIYLAGGSDLTRGIMGFPGIIILALINIVMAFSIKHIEMSKLSE
jgi:membrane protease YdiL (CAAX protease family)